PDGPAARDAALNRHSSPQEGTIRDNRGWFFSFRTSGEHVRMQITVRYFAIMREHLGKGGETLETPEGTTAGEARALATKDAPRLVGLQRSVMVMVNEDYAEPDQVLKEGDDVALIPPVSGGDEAKRFSVTDAEIDPRAVETLVAGPDAGAVVK